MIYDIKQLGHIYKITSPSDKLYIGQTVCVLNNGKKNGYEERWKQHKNAAISKEEGGCRALNRAIRKYGSKNFKLELIEIVPIEKMNERETYWIKELNTLSPNGYNLTTGGGSGTTHSDETRIRISKANKGLIRKNKNARKREEDNNLPKYVRSMFKEGKCIGYKIDEHPTIENKSFTSGKFSLDEKLKMAINYLETSQATKTPKIYELNPKLKAPDEQFKRKHSEDKNLPKYISSYHSSGRKGYIITHHTISKSFLSMKLTMEEKLQLAINFLQNPVEDKKPKLPKYITNLSTRGRTGYKTNHPKIKNKQFLSMELSMEEKLQLAIDYLKTAENQTTEDQQTEKE